MEELKILELMEAIQIFERKLTMSLVDSGLRIPQYRVLNILNQHGRSTVSELSKRMRITRAAASLLINEMLKNEYISTEENEIDRRSFHIIISDMGREKLNVAQKSLNAAESKLSRFLNEDAVKNLNQFSMHIIDAEKN